MRYRWIVLVAGIAGCFTSPDESLWKSRRDARSDAAAPRSELGPDGAPDRGGSGDGPAADLSTDTSPAKSCWSSGAPTFSTPVALDAVNSASTDIEPMLSPDGLTLYFASSRDGNMDAFLATRPSAGAPFANVQNNTQVGTADSETRFALSFDGLEAFLATNRAGGQGGADIWIATRTSAATPFAPADFSPAAPLNSTQNEWDPYPSFDGKRLYYAIQDWSSGLGSTDLVVATRSAAPGSYSPPQAIQGVNSPPRRTTRR